MITKCSLIGCTVHELEVYMYIPELRLAADLDVDFSCGERDLDLLEADDELLADRDLLLSLCAVSLFSDPLANKEQGTISI